MNNNHDRLPELIALHTAELISEHGDIVREIALINATISLANMALAEYGIELVVAVDFNPEVR